MAYDNDDTSRFPTRPYHAKRDGTITWGKDPIGRVIREVDGWSPAELNGDYLGVTHYKRQSDAIMELTNWFRAKWLREHPRPAHFRSAAKAFDANGKHTGPGDWLTVIREANGLAQQHGGEIIFDSPESTGDWWAGGYVEEYPDARVLHREDESVSIISKTARGADLIHRAARKHGWIA